MEAGIEARGGPGRGEHVPVVDVEHRVVEGDLGMPTSAAAGWGAAISMRWDGAGRGRPSANQDGTTTTSASEAAGSPSTPAIRYPSAVRTEPLRSANRKVSQGASPCRATSSKTICG